MPLYSCAAARPPAVLPPENHRRGGLLMHRFARFLILVSTFVSLSVPLHAACTVSLTAPAQVASDQSYVVTINEIAHTGYSYTLTEDWSGRLFFDQLRRATINEKATAFGR